VGRKDEAHRILQHLLGRSRQEYVSSYDAALIYVGLGDHDQAFSWLNQAAAERSLWLGYLKVGPQFDPLRRDQRFPDLLSRLGLLP
jgi:adenylate cyclase